MGKGNNIQYIETIWMADADESGEGRCHETKNVEGKGMGFEQENQADNSYRVER